MAKKDKPTSQKNDFEYIKESELPAEGNVYGGIIKLPDGRHASVYMLMGKKYIDTLEVTDILTNIMLTPEELQQDVTVNGRTVPLQRIVFEALIPYHYERRKK